MSDEVLVLEYIRLLEEVEKASRIIYEVTSTSFSMAHAIECPHGCIPGYPTHAWWCDDCWNQLKVALSELRDFRANLEEDHAHIVKFTLTNNLVEEKPIFSDKVKFLMMDGLKTTGNFAEALQYVQEELTHTEYEDMEEFFQYCIDNDLTFGHGNIDTRIEEWQAYKIQQEPDHK